MGMLKDFMAERSAHRGMLTRCQNPLATNYAWYGGRGVTVCAAWSGRGGFLRFLHDLGPRPSSDHTLDRLNVEGNYEPSNVRWATRKQQAINKRSVVLICMEGQTRNLTEWAALKGIAVGTVSRRIKHGWNPVRALLEKPYPRAKSITEMSDASSMNRSAEHNTWYGMQSRCYCMSEPSYRFYGARGVKMCDQWRGPEGFQMFLLDVGPRPTPRHTLDRVDVNGNYEPSNVRWATHDVQHRNMRTTTKITARGETRCLLDWSRISGVPVRTIGGRLRLHGWNSEDAIFTPSGRIVTSPTQNPVRQP